MSSKKSTANTKNKNRRHTQQGQQNGGMKKLIWIAAGLMVLLLSMLSFMNPDPEPVQFAYETLPVLGDPNAPVKIVKFGDFKCPGCQDFSQQIKPQLVKDYVDKGIASFYFMNIAFVGPDSNTAALAAQSVYHQSNESYWKFYDAVYKNQGSPKVPWATPEYLTELARKEGLSINYEQLRQEIDSKTYQNEINAQMEFGSKIGVRSTPSLFINGVKVEDVFDYDNLKKVIENTVSTKG
ncbi:DsbA family protein [Brevibacillus porteri]|uniref:DsbA family protein n=1 Tax=Brevibacillus porteri TaxID=2126350 RepID=UPI003644FA27